MENWLEGILIGVPILVFVVKTYDNQFITELVKKLFNGRSDQKAFYLFYSILIFFMFVGGTLLFYSDSNIGSTPEKNVIAPSKDSVWVNTDREKTDAEVIYDAGEVVFNETKEALEREQEKKQQLREAKGNRLIYQIGDIVDNEKSLFKRFKQLRNVSAINTNFLKVFKIKRNQFLIIYDLHKSEYEMNDGLSDFKASLSSVENNITIRELNQECRARQEIITTKSLNRRKFDFNIPCLACD